MAYRDVPLRLSVVERLLGFEGWDAIVRLDPQIEGAALQSSYFLVHVTDTANLDRLYEMTA